MVDAMLLDAFTLFDDGWCPAEIGVSGRHIVLALAVGLIVAVLDEGLDIGLKVARQEVTIKQDGVSGPTLASPEMAAKLKRTSFRLTPARDEQTAGFSKPPNADERRQLARKPAG